jgi:3-deoxy-D-manno-octulosonic-acid transferase
MTEKSQVRWFKFKKTISHLLSFFSLIISQDSTSEKRLKELGAKNVLTYGNLKHDSEMLPYSSKTFSEFEISSSGRNILVASSTHVGEEGRVLKIFKDLLPSMPNLLLVLAPRHPDRRRDVVNEIKNAGFFASDFILRSNSLNFDKNTKIFVLDSIGELGYFYKKANSVILGGAFENFGGHNPIEPARFGNAIFTGVNFYNFEEEYNNLVECNGAKVLKDDIDIEVIKDIDLVERMAINSKNYSESLGGAADKVVLKIVGLLNEN